MPTIRRMKTKVAFIGESGVGKTSLIRRFVFNEYQDTYLHTVGTKVSKIELTVPYGANVQVEMDMSIFDIMGQRGFQDLIRETYFHGAQALLAVCDCTRLDSLSALDDWIPSALEIAGDVPVYLLVNKIDLGDRRVVTEEQIRKIAEPFSAPHVLTSAKTGSLVEETFNAIAVEIVDRAMRQEQSMRVERGLREKLLVLLAKRGTLGLKKTQFFEILRGLHYDDLQREISRLEGEGLVAIMWHGPAEFTAAITPKGVEASKRVATPLDEE
ncbi:MAG TPA: Rab family GTPase [Thermoplasmata archaeon]|nr:Rab family GTPase [Thermoplasmata archaeon]